MFVMLAGDNRLT